MTLKSQVLRSKEQNCFSPSPGNDLRSPPAVTEGNTKKEIPFVLSDKKILRIKPAFAGFLPEIST